MLAWPSPPDSGRLGDLAVVAAGGEKGTPNCVWVIQFLRAVIGDVNVCLRLKNFNSEKW